MLIKNRYHARTYGGVFHRERIDEVFVLSGTEQCISCTPPDVRFART